LSILSESPRNPKERKREEGDGEGFHSETWRAIRPAPELKERRAPEKGRGGGRASTSDFSDVYYVLPSSQRRKETVRKEREGGSKGKKSIHVQRIITLLSSRSSDEGGGNGRSREEGRRGKDECVLPCWRHVEKL